MHLRHLQWKFEAQEYAVGREWHHLGLCHPRVQDRHQWRCLVWKCNEDDDDVGRFWKWEDEDEDDNDEDEDEN